MYRVLENAKPGPMCGCKMALRRWKAAQDTEPEEFDI